MECIRQIIDAIPQGHFFDSHYVTASLRQHYPAEYSALEDSIDSENNLTLRTHQKIGHLIARLNGTLVERQASQAWSINIYGNGSPCALWKRI